MDIHQHIPTHLSLLRKYGGRIMRATSYELQLAARTIPEGKNALKHLFEAMRLHAAERKHLQK